MESFVIPYSYIVLEEGEILSGELAKQRHISVIIYHFTKIDCSSNLFFEFLIRRADDNNW